MLNIKALGVLDCRTYLTEKFGPDAHDKVRALMQPGDRDIVYSEELTPLSWIDFRAVLNHSLAVDAALGRGTSDAMLQHLAGKHFNGVYRVMFQSAAPKDVLRKIASIWNRFYDKGEASVEFMDDNHATCRIHGLSEVPRLHERLILPYMATIMALSGVRGVQIEHTQCIADGADSCAFKYSWR